MISTVNVLAGHRWPLILAALLTIPACGPPEGSQAQVGSLVVEWANLASVTGGARVSELAASSDGNCIVAGCFNGGLVFHRDGAEPLDLASRSGTQAFLAKYGGDGQVAWAQLISDQASASERTCQVVSVCPVDNGACLVVGDFVETVTFASASGVEEVLESRARADIFVARYESDGSLSWAKSLGDADSANSVRDAVVLPDNSLVLVGGFAYRGEERAEGDGEPGARSAGDKRAPRQRQFLARYDAECRRIWMRSVAGPGTLRAEEIGLFPDGSFAVSGRFDGTVTLESGAGDRAAAATLTAASSDESKVANACIAKYAADGRLLWAKRAVVGDMLYPVTLAPLSDGSVLLASHLGFGDALAAPGAPDETRLGLTDPLGVNPFVCRFERDGTLSWAEVLPATGMGTSDGPAVSMGVLPKDRRLLAGLFHGSEYQAAPCLPCSGQNMHARRPSLPRSDGESRRRFFLAGFEADGSLAFSGYSGGDSRVGDIMVCAAPDGTCLVAGESEGTGRTGCDLSFRDTLGNEVRLQTPRECGGIFVAKCRGFAE